MNEFICDVNLYSFISKGHCGQPLAVKGPKLEHGRVTMPLAVFQLFLNHVEDIGSTWLEGCRGRAETFRDRCSNVKKQQINRGRYVMRLATLEDKAMALLIERKDFIKQNQVN